MSAQADALEGWVEKRGAGFLHIWSKRWFKLQSNVLVYAKQQGAAPNGKGTVDLLGSTCTFVPEKVTGKPHSLQLTVKGGRVIVFCLSQPDEATKWLRACRAASQAPVPVAGIQEPKEPLPTRIEVEGVPETGTELRVRTIGCDLDMLCISWFRVPADAVLPTSPDADVTSAAGYAVIPSTILQCYTAQQADVGYRIGAVVRRAVGSGQMWAVSSGPVVSANVAVPSVRLHLVSHEHHKYCDRRVRVCTTPGKYREGEVILASVRGPADVSTAYSVWWYRSTDVQSTGSTSAAGTSTGPLLDAKGKIYTLVHAKGRSSLAPAPPDHAPAPSLATIKSHLEALSSSAGAAPQPSGEYALFKGDVRHMILAALVPAGQQPPATVVSPGIVSAVLDSGVILSPPVGPVEAAPPRAREIIIQGEAKVGSTLTGWVYYVGGTPGPCEVTWVAIGDSGDVRDVKGPIKATLPPESQLLDGTGTAAGSTAASADSAWSLPLDAALVNHIIKLKVKPVRDDGNEGHTESSRPTAEVQA